MPLRKPGKVPSHFPGSNGMEGDKACTNRHSKYLSHIVHVHR